MTIVFRLFMAIGVSAILPGCAILLGPSDEGATRGKLSGAMEKASDHHVGSREISTPTSASTTQSESTSLLDILVAGSSSSTETSDYQNPDKESPDFSSTGIAFSRARSIYRDNHFQHHDAVEMALNFSQVTENAFRVYFRFDTANLKIGHPQYDSIDGSIDSIALGLRGHIETYRFNDYISTYMAFAFGASYTAWSYRNAIAVDGSTISSDGVTGGEGYGAVGIRFQPFRSFSTSLEFGPRLVIWNEVTTKKFENDVFGANLPFFLTLDIAMGK